MDFIKQLNGFRRKRLINPIGANCISLYLTLFEYSNELRFPERFTAPNSALQVQSGLSLRTMYRARNELMQKGYIVYKSGNGSQCGTYELVDLCKENDGQKEFDVQICHTNGTQTGTQNEQCQIEGPIWQTNCHTNGTQTVTIKQTKYK